MRIKVLTLIGILAIAVSGCNKSTPNLSRSKETVTQPSRMDMEIVRLDPSMDALVAPGTPIEKVATGFKFTEGPMWRNGQLWFSDLVGNRMYSVTPEGKITLLLDHSGGLANPPAGSYQGSNAMAADKDNTVLMMQHGTRRIVRLNERLEIQPYLESFEGKRLNSPNDLVFAPDGSLWFTDPPYGLLGQDKDPGKELPFNGVFHYVHGKLTAPIKTLTRPNGIGFSKDGKTLYVSNSGPAMFVAKYLVSSDGTVSEAGKLIEYPGSATDVPDGLKIDSVGNVWTTGPGGIRIISPAGKVLGQIKLPEVAANLAWADGGMTAYITASTSIYRIHLKTAGEMPLYPR